MRLAVCKLQHAAIFAQHALRLQLCSLLHQQHVGNLGHALACQYQNVSSSLLCQMPASNFPCDGCRWWLPNLLWQRGGRSTAIQPPAHSLSSSASACHAAGTLCMATSNLSPVLLQPTSASTPSSQTSLHMSGGPGGSPTSNNYHRPGGQNVSACATCKPTLLHLCSIAALWCRQAAQAADAGHSRTTDVHLLRCAAGGQLPYRQEQLQGVSAAR